MKERREVSRLVLASGQIAPVEKPPPVLSCLPLFIFIFASFRFFRTFVYMGSDLWVLVSLKLRKPVEFNDIHET